MNAQVRHSGKIRATRVRKVPMWNPFAMKGRGSWTMVPADTTHNVVESTVDEDGDPAGVRNSYEAKGFIPLVLVDDPEKLAELPVNWKERAADPRVRPVYRSVEEVRAEQAALRGESPKRLAPA